MPRIAQFNGGINRATASHLINTNEAFFYQNIDHVPGPLTPQRNRQLHRSSAKRFGHKFTVTSEWYFSDVPMDWVEYQDRLYIGNREGESTKIVDGIEYKLGIDYPTEKPVLSAVSDDVLEIEEVTDTITFLVQNGNIISGDIPTNETLKYRIVNEAADGKNSGASETYVTNTPSTGVPSEPGGPVINVYGALIIFNGIDENVHAIRIYRLYDGVYRLVDRHEILPDETNYTVADTTFDISAADPISAITLGAKGSITGDEVSYAMTYYNSNDGTESVPVLSDSVEVVSGYIEISNLEISTDPQVDKKRLYRVGGNLTTYTLVTTLNNAVTEYVDRAADNELPGDLLDSEANFPPPENIKYLTEAYAMLFAAKGSKLYFTPIGQPNYWPETYFLDFPRQITGIGKTAIGLLVFSRFETWLVTGTGPLSLAQQEVSSSQGCINGDTVVNIEAGCLWASTDGVCASNGGRVDVISRIKLDKVTFKTAVNAVVHDDRYYLIEDSEAFGTHYIWMFDLVRDVILNTVTDVDSLIIADDKLLGHDEGKLYEVYGKEDEDAELLEMVYWSPKFIGPGFTIPKVYKNIYVYSYGEIDVEVYINNVMVQKVNFDTFDNHQIKIPEKYTRGYDIYFLIRGTGTVYEIQWDDGDATA